eukprot:12882466-Ditylum_brightwellii.AAC.1
MVLIQPSRHRSNHPASLTHCHNWGQKKHPHPSEFTTFSGFSLNANGIRTNDGQKLEQVCHQLAHSTADFFCLQETWLKGNYDPMDIATPKGLTDLCLLFHHKQEKQSPRGSGRAAILLSASGKRAWESAGKPSPINRPLITGIACLIGLPLQYKEKPSRSFSSAHIFQTLVVITMSLKTFSTPSWRYVKWHHSTASLLLQLTSMSNLARI